MKLSAAIVALSAGSVHSLQFLKNSRGDGPRRVTTGQEQTTLFSGYLDNLSRQEFRGAPTSDVRAEQAGFNPRTENLRWEKTGFDVIKSYDYSAPPDSNGSSLDFEELSLEETLAELRRMREEMEALRKELAMGGTPEFLETVEWTPPPQMSQEPYQQAPPPVETKPVGFGKPTFGSGSYLDNMQSAPLQWSSPPPPARAPEPMPSSTTSGGNYLDALTGSAQASLPKSNYMYGSGNKPKAASGSGMGSYFDSMTSSKPLEWSSTRPAATPVPAPAPNTASTTSSSSSSSSNGNYLEALAGPAKAFMPKSNYMYGGGKPKAASGTGMGSYFDSMSSSSTASTSASYAPPATTQPAAPSSGNYLEALAGSAKPSTPKSNYMYGGGSKPKAPSGTGMGSFFDTMSSSTAGSSASYAPLETKPASGGDYLSNLAGSAKPYMPKSNYMYGGGSKPKAASGTGMGSYFDSMMTSKPMEWSSTPAATPTPAPAQPAVTTSSGNGNYLEALAGPAKASMPKSNYMYGGGSKPKAPSGTGIGSYFDNMSSNKSNYMYGGSSKPKATSGSGMGSYFDSMASSKPLEWSSTSPAATSAPSPAHAQPAATSSASSGNYLEALAGPSKPSMPKSSYMYGSGNNKPKAASGSGMGSYFDSLNSKPLEWSSTAPAPAPTPATVPAPSPAEPPAASNSMYLGGPPRASPTPRPPVYEPVKSTGYLGGLSR